MDWYYWSHEHFQFTCSEYPQHVLQGLTYSPARAHLWSQVLQISSWVTLFQPVWLSCCSSAPIFPFSDLSPWNSLFPTITVAYFLLPAMVKCYLRDSNLGQPIKISSPTFLVHFSVWHFSVFLQSSSNILIPPPSLSILYIYIHTHVFVCVYVYVYVGIPSFFPSYLLPSFFLHSFFSSKL